jgi:transposase-like protein
MVTITLHCPHCGSKDLMRDGHAPNGKQTYRCHTCGRRSRENPTPHAYSENLCHWSNDVCFHEAILASYPIHLAS